MFVKRCDPAAQCWGGLIISKQQGGYPRGPLSLNSTEPWLQTSVQQYWTKYRTNFTQKTRHRINKSVSDVL